MQALQRSVEGVQTLIVSCEHGHKAANFGTAAMFSHVLDVVVGEMARMIMTKNTASRADVDAVTVGLLMTVENEVLMAGRGGAVAEAGHYGILRHLLGMGERPTLRWLWGTVFALLWVFSTGANQDEFVAAARSIHGRVGDSEFRLFGVILISLHRLLGILPVQMFSRVERYFSA